MYEISGYPPSLRIEDAVDRPNTELEKIKYWLVNCHQDAM